MMGNQRIAVIGLGVENTPLVRFLKKQGHQVTVFDKQDRKQLGQRYEEFEGLGVNMVLGSNYLDNLRVDEYDTIFVTPGMPKDLPKLLEAKEKGVRLRGQTDLFLEVCQAPIIGVTGSAGKTTTTTLIYEILKSSGRKVFLGGNIGRVLLEDVESITKDSIVVLELSSFQLELARHSPDIAVVLNIQENHLDIHGTMEKYVLAKKQIMEYQDEGDWLILNDKDPVISTWDREAKGKVAYFGRELGAHIEDDYLLWNGERIVAISDIRLPGKHNLMNALAAIAVSKILGVAKDVIADVLRTFEGIEHRLEPVRAYRGVRFINDSIATSPDRTRAALASFEEPIFLIAGGYDKGLSYEELAKDIVRRVKVIFLMGETAKKIGQAVEKEKKLQGSDILIRYVESMAEAVSCAYALAAEGDLVLLSPGAASYDMFSNYVERGRVFKKLVADLL